jgi:hypothetical protein
LHPRIGSQDFLKLFFERREGGSEEESLARLCRVAAPMFLDPRGLLYAPRPRDDERQLRGVEGFDQVIHRAEAHRVHRTCHAAIGGHYDDRGIGGKRAITEEVGAQAIRQVDVEQCEVDGQIRGETARRLECSRTVTSAPSRSIGLRLASQQRLVLDEEDAHSGEEKLGHGSVAFIPAR